MNEQSLPIGFFDSGVGGISVLRHALKLLPGENYIFLGDSANAPYGTRSDEEIFALSKRSFDRLLKIGVKAVVIACNTATSVAAERLRAAYPQLPIIGAEPALKPAAEQHRGGRILVMGTEATLRRSKYAVLMSRFSAQAEIIPVHAPELVEYIERGMVGSKELDAYLSDVFSEVPTPADAIVLGCTHYPFAAEQILRAAGGASGSTDIYEGGEGIVKELKRRLKQKNLLNDSDEPAKVVIENTGGKKMTELSERLLDM